MCILPLSAACITIASKKYRALLPLQKSLPACICLKLHSDDHSVPRKQISPAKCRGLLSHHPQFSNLIKSTILPHEASGFSSSYPVSLHSSNRCLFTTPYISKETRIISLTEVIPSSTYLVALMRRVLIPSFSAFALMSSAEPFLLIILFNPGVTSIIS